MQSPGAPGRLQAKTRHYFQRLFVQRRAIRRKQNPPIPFRYFQGERQQRLEILLDLERLPAVRPREGRRIENDDVEFFAFAREPREEVHHVVRDETMIVRRLRVQGKIFAPARERFF